MILESDLREIVREELKYVLLEANPHHDPKTGKLSSGDVGDVYSISEPVEKKYGNEAKKGITTSKGKIQAKFGMATGKDACGRKDITGKDIYPVWKCSDYKKPYYNRKSSNDLTEQQEEETDVVKQCRAMGMQTFQELLNALNSAVAAGKGELYKQKSK